MPNTLTPPPIFAFTIAFADDASGDSGLTVGQFQEVSGLSVPIAVEDVAEGGVNRFVRQLPGAVKHSNLVLKRGIVPSGSALVDWVAQTLDGTWAQPIATRTLLVQLLDASGHPLLRWRFTHAWPVKWDDATISPGGDRAIEALELAYASVTRLP